MSTATRTNEERAAEFVAAVRDRLSDLPRDEVDELTDGLAADLVDRLSDGNELGDPRSYAEELRQAAGLPERVEPESAPQPREGLMDQGRALASRWREWWDETSGRRGVRDFVLSLRSVWWVLRGVAVATVFCLLFGISSGGGVAACHRGSDAAQCAVGPRRMAPRRLGRLATPDRQRRRDPRPAAARGHRARPPQLCTCEYR
ncbi:HAAS signaling domain-containing protein [Leucobacter luti]|uniref:HAAS signaling domain-containing protein n=1 Tax=Leucobacter luti TaxID=340320 RepID=UPI0037C170AA